MAENDIWFPFYIGDYLKDTLCLTLEEHGAYLLLLICFWSVKGLMPDDDASFASITRTSLDHWKTKLRPKLSPFFKIENGKWLHSRVMREAQKAELKSQARSKAGKLGGRPKQNESKTKANEKLIETSHSHSHILGTNNPPGEEKVESPSPSLGPTLAEVQAHAAMTGIPPAEAEKFWHHFESSGWIDKNRNPVRKWQSKLATWSADARGRPAESAHQAAEKGSPRPAGSVFELGKVKEAKMERAKQLFDRHCSPTASGNSWSNTEARAEYRKLKAEISDLTKRIAGMA